MQLARLGRLRRLPPKLKLIKVDVVRRSQTRCKQIKLFFQVFFFFVCLENNGSLERTERAFSALL